MHATPVRRLTGQILLLSLLLALFSGAAIGLYQTLGSDAAGPPDIAAAAYRSVGLTLEGSFASLMTLLPLADHAAVVQDSLLFYMEIPYHLCACGRLCRGGRDHIPDPYGGDDHVGDRYVLTPLDTSRRVGRRWVAGTCRPRSLQRSSRPCHDSAECWGIPAMEDRMDQTLDVLPGFAPDYDCPIPYMSRTRAYYAAIGYTTPYRWAHNLAAPFAPLIKQLSQSKVAIVTTAAPYQPGKGDQGPGAPYNGSAKFYAVYSGDTARDHDLRISHIGYDRTHTTATDSNTWFPLPALRRAAAAGRIGAVAPRFHGAPTNRSHRVTVETDAPEILGRRSRGRGRRRHHRAELSGLPPDQHPGGAPS